jgi:hypothetical protein
MGRSRAAVNLRIIAESGTGKTHRHAASIWGRFAGFHWQATPLLQ